MSNELSWQTEQIRMSAFSTQFNPKQILGFWKSCFPAIDPDKLTQGRGTETSIAESEIDDLTVCQAAIVDATQDALSDSVEGLKVFQLLFRPKPKLNEYGNLGLYKSVAPQFHEIALAWLRSNSTPPISRLAFGTFLFDPASDIDTAYRKLEGFLPGIWHKDARDLIFQINF